ncbi:MAG: hypothetical protein H5T69_10670, partial [Chloroflexi bacterium]|nr:hypothetical protein [Chloroflexota bacterium]
MAVSHSEQVEAICPYCETPFSTEAWTIVDVWERPDLAVRLQQGLLHITFCPHCQKRVAVDTPLLVYRLYKDPPFLLSMPDDTSEEDARAHAAVLLGRLREALGKDWKPSWLDHQYETIDRVEVRVLLNLDLILLIR